MDGVDQDQTVEYAVKRVLLIAWQRKAVFLTTAILMFGATLTKTLSEKPAFQGTTILIAGGVDQGADSTRDGKNLATSIALLCRIAESDEVVRAAIDDVGLTNLIPPMPAGQQSLTERFYKLIGRPNEQREAHVVPLELDLPRVIAALNVRGEQNASLIRIAYRNSNPEVAAQFANAVARRFIERQAILASRSGTAEFFALQRKRFEQEARQAIQAMQALSARTAIFSIDDQRLLLLNRREALALAISTTKGVVSEESAQRQALADELRKLIPVARSPYVSSLVDALDAGRATDHTTSRITDDRSTDPPLLLIKVYQDTMASLFKINADLIGSQSLLKEQADQITNATAELNTLTQTEGEFTQLKHNVDQAVNNLDVYSKRMVAEQVESEMSIAKFSSIKVLQQARRPMHPISPNFLLSVAVSSVVSVISGLIMAFFFRKRSTTNVSNFGIDSLSASR